MLICFAVIGYARWAKVDIQPLYSDARFQPSDKLHATCTNSAEVFFSPQGQTITKANIILSYNPEHLEILRVMPTVNDGSASSKIEYNKIILEITNPTFTSSTETKSFFQIFFKSAIEGEEIISIAEWSQALTKTEKSYPLAGNFSLKFAKVPECEPDIIPPSINLIYPKDSNEKIYLDQYFIFDIKDIGKGVNKESVIINFDGDQYFYDSEHLKWNGTYLTFYPDKRIPIDTSLDLKIMVADKQSYGWANKTESVYSFHSASGMMLHKEISPMIFRRIAQEAEKISASVDECWLLAELYAKSEVLYQKELKSIIQKLWCSLASLDTSTLDSALLTSSSMTTEQKQYRNVSVFATLGWILFFLAFTLKIHYILSYKKHKRLNTEKREPKK